MLNLELGQELILISILLACIAWLMGRAVCTSKEYQVRSKLKMLKKEQDHLTTVVTQKDHEIQQLHLQIKKSREESEKQLEFISIQKEDESKKLLEQLKNKRTQLSAIKQDYDIEHTSLDHLKSEHNKILAKMQNLTAFDVKFKALSQYHEEQSLECIHLKNNLNNSQKEFKSIRNLNQQQQYDLKKYKSENKQLNMDYNDQVEKNISLNASLKAVNKDLMSSINLIAIQKGELERCKSNNDALSKDIQAYKILSTI